MANYPKKMKDPTEVALSAIQDALSIRDNPPESDPAASPPLPPVSVENEAPLLKLPPA